MSFRLRIGRFRTIFDEVDRDDVGNRVVRVLVEKIKRLIAITLDDLGSILEIDWHLTSHIRRGECGAIFRRAIALLLPKRNGTSKSQWPSSGAARSKKAPAMPGLLYSPYPGRRSVSCNHRSAPVEAVDQFGADGLNPFLRIDRNAGRASAAYSRDETNFGQPVLVKL
jgi:hypothetical protein